MNNTNIMKLSINHILIISIIGLFGWNLWLTLRAPNEPIQPYNYEIFDSLYKRNEKRISTIEHEINQIDQSIMDDSIFVHSADRKTRDSLRAIYNPR